MWFSYPPPPITPPSSPAFSHSDTPMVDPIWFQGDDIKPMSLKALREIFKDFDSSQLPSDLVACLAGDRAAISANHSAYHLWLQQSQASTSSDPPPNLPAPSPATSDPLCTTSINPNPPQFTLRTAPQPASITPNSQPAPVRTAPTPHTQATVPRAVQCLDRDESTPPDLVLQVCQNAKTSDPIHTSRMNWDPELLFPELSNPPAHRVKSPLMTARTNLTKLQTPASTVQSHPLHRTTKGRINKKANSQVGLEKLDAHAFVDVPLQYEEGQRILQLIGAGDTPIPNNLMGPAQLQANPIHQAETSQAQAKANQAHTLGPSTRAKLKGKKPVTLPPKRGRPRRASSSQLRSHNSAASSNYAQPPRPAFAPLSTHTTSQGLPPLPSGVRPASLSPGVNQIPQLVESSIPESPMALQPHENPLHIDDGEDDPYLDRIHYSGDEHESLA